MIFEKVKNKPIKIRLDGVQVKSYQSLCETPLNTSKDLLQ